MPYVATIKKESLKFSAAHMTVFPDGSKESMHGHNFRTEIRLCFEKAELDSMLSFGDIKKSIKKICEAWDEKFLLAIKCPFLKNVSKNKKSLEFTLSEKFYTLPIDEVVELGCDNITTENLAFLFCTELVSRLDKVALKQAKTKWVEVKIEEILGQGASYRYEFKK